MIFRLGYPVLTLIEVSQKNWTRLELKYSAGKRYLSLLRPIFRGISRYLRDIILLFDPNSFFYFHRVISTMHILNRKVNIHLVQFIFNVYHLIFTAR